MIVKKKDVKDRLEQKLNRKAKKNELENSMKSPRILIEIILDKLENFEERLKNLEK